MSKGLRWRKTESSGIRDKFGQNKLQSLHADIEISQNRRWRTNSPDLFLIYYVHLFGLTHRVSPALLFRLFLDLYPPFHFVFRYKSVEMYMMEMKFFGASMLLLQECSSFSGTLS